MLNIQDLSSGIRMIGLDRADKRNAIGVELTLALEEVLLDTRYRDDIRALVFHGIGGHFCAGMDLKDFFDSSTRPPRSYVAPERPLNTGAVTCCVRCRNASSRPSRAIVWAVLYPSCNAPTMSRRMLTQDWACLKSTLALCQGDKS